MVKGRKDKMYLVLAPAIDESFFKMAKVADIGGKRLISLAPSAWARWCTGDPTVEAVDLLSGEFQWVSRTNDVLLKVRSPARGDFLIPTEIQFHPHPRMARRINAYASLAEERYDLDAYPVVVNILPPGENAVIPSRYEVNVFDLEAQRTFRVINLWEVDVEPVFTQNLVALLPFVPVLRGGHTVAVVTKAVTLLRADETLSELESLLAFFATFVLDAKIVRDIMRWDMAVLRESPWYIQILEEGIGKGLEQGIEQGREEGREEGSANMLLLMLRHRFGQVEPALEARIRQLPMDDLSRLVNVALDASSIGAVEGFLDSSTHRSEHVHGNGDGAK